MYLRSFLGLFRQILPKHKLKITFVFLSANECGGELNGESGQLKSPNYPNDYGNNKDCEWVINVPAGSTVTLEFEFHFDVR